MSCRGTCTVRIHESRNLKADKWPQPLDREAALRYLKTLVEKKTAESKETGCESDGCQCVPLADYMPDETTGKRKKEPEWTVWRKRTVIDTVGSDDRPEHIFGNVETRSAIVPGLCEPNGYVDHHTPTHAGEHKKE